VTVQEIFTTVRIFQRQRRLRPVITIVYVREKEISIVLMQTRMAMLARAGLLRHPQANLTGVRAEVEVVLSVNAMFMDITGNPGPM